MLTLTKIRNWANSVPNNVKAIIAPYISALDFSYMSLNEDTHTYVSAKNPDIEWTSVTTYIKKFEPTEDWDSIAEKYGKKHGIQTHVVRDMWAYNSDCASAIGSTCHLFGELICNIAINMMLGLPIETELDTFKIVFPFQFKNDTFLPCMISQAHIIDFWETIFSSNNRWPVKAECIVDDPTTAICGSIDMLMLESDLSLSIWDYKTSKVLNNPYSVTKNVKLLNEYSNLYNEPLSLYTIQLIQYKRILECHGVNTKNMYIIHVPNTEGSELKVVPLQI